MDRLSSLPDLILFIIIQFLPQVSLLNVRLVNRRLAGACSRRERLKFFSGKCDLRIATKIFPDVLCMTLKVQPEGNSLGYLSRLQNLTELNIASLPAPCDDLSCLSSLRHLRSVEAPKHLTANGLKIFADAVGSTLKELRLFRLRNMRPEALVSIGSFSVLAKLSITGCQLVTDSFLELVCSSPFSPYLQHLDVSDSGPFGDDGVEFISRLPLLNSLVLKECGAITDESIHHIGRISGLTQLGFGPSPSLTKDCLNFLNCTKLRRLLVLLPQVDGEGLQCLSRLSCLERFVLLSDTDDHGLRVLGQLPRLTSLHLLICPGVVGEGVAHMAKNKAISDLHIFRCAQFTTLKGLATLQSLEALRLFNLWDITDDEIALLSGLPKLQMVHVHDCPGVSSDIAKVLPNVRKVRFTAEDV